MYLNLKFFFFLQNYEILDILIRIEFINFDIEVNINNFTIITGLDKTIKFLVIMKKQIF